MSYNILTDLVELIKQPYLEALHSGGRQGFWKYRLDALQKVRKLEGNDYIIYARTYSELGDKEKALGSLERALQERAFLMPFVSADPAFDSLRAEPRFQEILRKMKLSA